MTRRSGQGIRVAFVCQWYPPEPAAVPASISQALAASGMQVGVLTGVPNYPTGRVAPGYAAWRPSRETVDGIAVSRAPLYPSHDASAARRMLNYLSWSVSSTVFGQALLRSSDVSLVYSSPATAALPAMVARVLWGTPYVLMVQDVWPDSVFASGFLPGRAGRLVEGLMERAVGLTYTMADHVAVISPGMVDLLVSRGVPRRKLSVVHNWAPDEDPTPEVPASERDALRRSWGATAGDFVLMYAGNHGHAQALDPIVEAFVELGQASGCHLVMVGDGVVKAALRERSRGTANIHFLDPVPSEVMAELRTGADAQLVSLADAPLFAVTMPSKVQAILASGQPLLVSARGDAAAAVEQAGAGVAVVPGDTSGVREAVLRLAGASTDDRAAMGRRGREWYLSEMSREVGTRALKGLLARAARSSSTGVAAPPRTWVADARAAVSALPVRCRRAARRARRPASTHR